MINNLIIVIGFHGLVNMMWLASEINHIVLSTRQPGFDLTCWKSTLQYQFWICQSTCLAKLQRCVFATADNDQRSQLVCSSYNVEDYTVNWLQTTASKAVAK